MGVCPQNNQSVPENKRALEIKSTGKQKTEQNDLEEILFPLSSIFFLEDEQYSKS